MTRRMLDSAIWQNEKFGVMPSMARLLAIGIINQADDQGRGKAHPVYLRSQLFPYDDVTPGEVAEWLRAVAGNETILLYQVDGKDYYQILNWWTYQAHQYAMPSQYPKPDGWQDRIRRTLTKGVIVTCNWITTDGKHSPDTCNEQGLAIQVNKQVNEQVNTLSTNQVNIQDSDKDKDKDKDYVEDKEVAAAPPLTAPAKPKRERKVKPDKPEVPEQVTWFRSVIGRFPPKELYPQVVAVVDGRRDSELLAECWQSWIAAGYNRANYAWFLDWYKSGRIARRNGSGPASEGQAERVARIAAGIMEKRNGNSV